MPFKRNLQRYIVLFCDLLDQLALRGKKTDMEGVKVTFLGQLPESANEKLTMKGGVRVRTVGAAQVESSCDP